MIKKVIAVGSILGAATVGLVGGTMLNALPAFAQDATVATNNPTPATSAPPQGKFDRSKGGHVGVNGKKEEILTGDTADKVKAAAQAAVSGGTIERVETDAEGSPYEAHMTKSDGSRVTVKVDSNFKVTSIDSGMR